MQIESMRWKLCAASFTALSSVALAQNVPYPSSDTSEWRFTGHTNGVLTKSHGPGVLEFADGATGATSLLDVFTTTTAAGIPDFVDGPGPVLAFGPHCPNTLGYKLRALTQAGAGEALQQCTMIWDVYLDANNIDGYQGLWQTSHLNNNDAELHLEIQTGGFWHDFNNSGAGGSIGVGTWSRGAWNRFVFVNDWTNNKADLYVNGVAAFTDSSMDYMYNGDAGLNTWILSDQNCDCTSGWIANFAISDVLLSATTIAQLGSPRASGIFSDCTLISYCTSSSTTNGCHPALGASSSGASISGGPGSFVVSCTGVEGQKTGLIFYGISGQNSAPWGVGSTSVLCVKAPTQRGPSQGSGGTLGACNGTITLDFFAFMNSHPLALGQPIAAGQTYDAQCWFRDPPAPKTTNLSNGLEFRLCP